MLETRGQVIDASRPEENVGPHGEAPRADPAPAAARPGRVRVSRGICLYVARGLLLNCTVAFLVLEVVQGVIFTIRAAEDLPLSFDILIIFPILLMAFAQAVTHTLPVALLFGTSLLAGRLNGDREVLALKSFGVSPLQILLPVAAIGGAMAILAYGVNTRWAPPMRYMLRNAESIVLERLGYLGEGYGLDPKTSDWSLWVYHYDGPVLTGIFLTINKSTSGFPLSKEVLEQVKTPSYPLYLYARRGIAGKGTGEHAGNLVLHLQDVNVFLDNRFLSALGSEHRGEKPAVPVSTEPNAHRDFMQRFRMKDWVFAVPLPRKDPAPKDMANPELAAEIWRRREHAEAEGGAGGSGGAEARRDYLSALTEWHRRLALSLSAVTFPVGAFAIGLFLVSLNRLLPFFLASTLIPALYFPLEIFGSGLARRGILPSVTTEFGNIGILLLAAVLLFRISRAPR
ncbi:MAG TPA: LptF/LptG family permease [Planctomycetota bacterium]|nr:LptF/LptG family permease [Planctomycetota bacterium]